MRISLSGVAWDPAQDDAVAALLRWHHVDAVDLAPGKYVDADTVDATDLRELRRSWERRGCQIVGMQSLLFGVQLTLFGPPDDRARLLQRLAAQCRVGRELGASRLVFGSPRSRFTESRSPEEVARIGIDFFSRLGDIADSFDVRVLLEPSPVEYGSSYMATTAETAAVVREVDHPAIGLQLDLGAITMNAEDVDQVVRDHGALVGHVHVSSPRLAPVRRTPDIENAASTVRTALPESIACIEMLTQDEPLEEIDEALAVTTALFRSEPGATSEDSRAPVS